jgi:hypothetical protein
MFAIECKWALIKQKEGKEKLHSEKYLIQNLYVSDKSVPEIKQYFIYNQSCIYVVHDKKKYIPFEI